MSISAVVAGTGFYNPRVIGTHVCREGSTLILRREPRNPHDANAIAVHVSMPVLGVFPRLVKLGHLKAPLAKRLAPKMDAGAAATARVVSFWNPGEIEHPRLSISIDI